MAKMTCKVCGASYSFCPGCVKDMNKPRWMTSFDSEKCKKVFDALVANTTGKMTDSETLSVVDASGVNVASVSILSHLSRIRDNKNIAIEEKKPDKITKSSFVTAKEEDAKVGEKAEHTGLFKHEEKEEELSHSNKKNEIVKEGASRSIGSLFSKNNFSSNSKNKEKVRQDAASIALMIDQLNEKQGF